MRLQRGRKLTMYSLLYQNLLQFQQITRKDMLWKLRKLSISYLLMLKDCKKMSKCNNIHKYYSCISDSKAI